MMMKTTYTEGLSNKGLVNQYYKRYFALAFHTVLKSWKSFNYVRNMKATGGFARSY